ncbi:MAG: circularly permuted type 2 ATP-grasp protein [Cyclobacteriaceae bacterium]
MLENYKCEGDLFDEMLAKTPNAVEHYQKFVKQFAEYDKSDFLRLKDEAKIQFFNEGITFATYNNNAEGTERIFPFDMIPRIIPAKEWDTVEKGLIQRNMAINAFLDDLYHDKKILKEGIVPLDLIQSSINLLAQMQGVDPPGGIYNHISGTDLIRHNDGEYYILEDNVRVPSGVSYVLANRNSLKKTLPKLFKECEVQLVQEYPDKLLQMMQSVAPQGVDEPNCVLLTPGMYNSAYFEHSFLAQSMGIDLVEGRDLFVDNNFVYTKTIYGPKRVDVIYRRVDDLFIDPLEFRQDSALGTAGLMHAYREGNVAIVNAPGTGVADDKAVYIYMPEIIKYYLGEEAILKNVPTYRCEKEDDYKYVMENIHQLVVKPVDESGGYGISIGSTLTKAEIEEVKQTIKGNRRKYIAQPIMSLSVHPTYIEDSDQFEPRHIDLRTFCLQGKDFQYVLPGGLTRVALKKGTLIVNSSQGGGSKDTWILS